jgi:hypothetical protein
MEERTDLPVLAGTEARPIERAQRSALPIPARAATGGLVLAATYLLVRLLRRPARRPAIRMGRRRGRRNLEIAGSRSFLVDVHVLKR